MTLLTALQLATFLDMAGVDFDKNSVRVRDEDKIHPYQINMFIDPHQFPMEKLCWYFRKSKYEIFIDACSWSSRSGDFQFGLMPEYEEAIRQIVTTPPSQT